MRVVRIGDRVQVYVEEGHLIFYGDYKTLMLWDNTERHKLGSNKKIHGLE